MNIETIHDSLVNGQRKQMTKQIDEYGIYDFWSDYADFLGCKTDHGIRNQFNYFRDAVISYHRTKNR